MSKLEPATKERLNFSAKDIEAAQPGTVIRDHAIKGLHVVVGQHARTFYLYYRTKLRQERRYKLGRFPIMTITQAREKARAVLVAVANGQDPAQQEQEARDQATVAEWAERFMLRTEAHCKPRTVKEYRLYMDRIVKRWGKRKVSQITARDVAENIRPKLESVI